MRLFQIGFWSALVAGSSTSCAVALDYSTPSEDCFNDRDDDFDGKADCLDTDCMPGVPDRSLPLCTREVQLSCFDALDNDGDGVADERDPECWGLLDPASPQRIDVVRCSSIFGTALDASLDAAEGWAGDIRSGMNGLEGPIDGTTFRATWVNPLSGVVPGTSLEASVGVAGTSWSTEVALAPDVTAPDLEVIAVKATRADGNVTVWLTADGEPIATGTEAVGHLETLDVRLRFSGTVDGCPPADPVNDDFLRARVGLGDRVICLEAPAPSRVLASRTALLQVSWRGEARTARALSLRRLRIDRDGENPCDETVPSAAHASVKEIHSMASRVASDVGLGGPTMDVCGVGAEGSGALLALPGSLAATPTFRPRAPNWSPPVRLSADARYGVVAAHPDGTRFLVVTSAADADPDGLSMFVGPCDGLRPNGPVRLDLRAPDPAAPSGVSVIATSLDARLSGAWLWLLVTAPGDARAHLVPCLLDVESGLCVSHPERQLGLSPISRLGRYELPHATGYAAASTFHWVVGDGVDLELQEKGPNDAARPMLTRADDASRFDQWIRSGALMVEPVPRALTGSPLYGWLVYVASSCRAEACGTGIGTARVRFLTGP